MSRKLWCREKFGVKKFSVLREFCQGIFGIKEIFSKTFWCRKISVSMKFRCQKNFGFKEILKSKNFWYQRNFGVREILGKGEILVSRNFGVWKNSVSEKFWCQGRKFWCQGNFDVKEISVSRKF